MEDYRFINDRQYGFCHGRLIGDLLVYLTHRRAAAIESKREGLTVSLDMTKAFERVGHGALLAKLPCYGYPENLCKWIASFLTGRSIVFASNICP